MNSADFTHPEVEGATLHGPVRYLLSYPSGLINDSIPYTLRVYTDAFVKMFICVIGVGANIINIVIFIQIGFRDSVGVAFFSLAFADVGFVLCTIVYQLLESVDNIGRITPYINLRNLSYYINLYAFMFADISILITVFTSLQKCACVAIPFLFKKIFTYFRSAVVITTIYFVVVIEYTPILVISGLVPNFDRATNRTRLSFPSTQLRSDVWRVFETSNRVILPFTSIILVTASLIIMNRKLQEASRIRQVMTTRRDNTLSEGNVLPVKNNLSTKELKAIEAVVVISAIFVACHLPDMVTFLSSLVINILHNNDVYRLVRAVQNLLAVINSTATIFVYVKFNSKYRARFLVVYGRFWCHAARG